MIIKYKKVIKFSNLFLGKLSLNKIHANLISTKLVNSDMCGHFSHGVNRLIQYHNGVKKKIYRPNIKPKLISKKNNFILVDGRHSFGQLAMDYACRLIIKQKNLINISSIINTGHIGRLSDYNEFFSKKNLISLIFCNGGGPNTSIYPITKRVVGTNPFSCGIPVTKNNFFTLDFATSKLAEGKINLAALSKQKLKTKPIISKHGKYSNNPNDLYAGGALIPFGEIKGSGFLLLNEILGGILISKNNPLNKNYIDGNNCLVITIDRKIFDYNNSFISQFNKLKKILKKSKRVKGYNLRNTYFPGELEKEVYKKSIKKGINYNNKLIKRLNDFAKKELNFDNKDLLKN